MRSVRPRTTGILLAGGMLLAGASVPVGQSPAPAASQIPAGAQSQPGQTATPQAAPPQFPPRGTGLSPDERAGLQKEVDALAAIVARLHARYTRGALHDRIADVEVYLDAVRRPLKYDERLYAPRDSTPLATARRTLATGADRAAKLAEGSTPWTAESGVRGFYSRIDGTAQPYLLTVPEGFDPAARRQYRLDVFMHGRDDQVLEQQFMAKPLASYTNKPLGPGPDRFLLQPYGRYTNASRFAGETDALEAIDDVMNRYPIDPDRVVMSGFSMGGASAWSFLVHHPDRWAAGAPGAGFTETAVFLRGALAKQPQNAVQRTLWHLYDSTDYAANTFNVPIVAYSGGSDPQKQAADAMAAAMREEGLTLEHVIGPDTGHSYEPRARQQVQDRLDALVSRGRIRVPKEIRFTTWTLRYNRVFWLTLNGMERHWQRARADARIDGNTIHVTTTNVTALRLAFETGQAPFADGARPVIQIDGATIPGPAVSAGKPLSVGLVRTGNSWKRGDLPGSAGTSPAAGGLRKRHGLQGPIDDAFMESFMFVRPTGTPLSDALGKWAMEQADYAESEWVHFFRGEPRVKRDVEVTGADIAAHNLVLFGDPSSNAIYRRIASRLPIRWTANGVVAGGQRFPKDHAPVFIFPNPLNPRRYVVINSGFTFHDQSNNAMQSPKLPDWAVVDITKPGNNYRYLPLFVASQGFFDERWALAGPMTGVDE